MSNIFRKALSHHQENWVFGSVGCSNRTVIKHTSEVVKKCLESVLELPFQRPDLNPTENMWTLLEKQVQARKLTN